MIILTDWPKFESIEANYRGLESDFLFEKAKELFHLMMDCMSEECGGYVIRYHSEELRKELLFRKDYRFQEFLGESHA